MDVEKSRFNWKLGEEGCLDSGGSVYLIEITKKNCHNMNMAMGKLMNWHMCSIKGPKDLVLRT